MPDWRGKDTDASVKLVGDGKVSLQNRISEYLEKERLLKKRGPLRGTRNAKDLGLANKWDLLALDHMWQWAGLGAGLSEFAALKPAVLTGRSYERWFESLQDLPPDVVASTPEGRVQRACLEDLESGQTRLEVCWSSPRQTCVYVYDT